MKFLIIIRNGLIIVGGLYVIIHIFIFVMQQSWFSSFDAEHLIKTYNQEEIEHFSRFAFQNGRLRKWYVDPRIEIVNHSPNWKYKGEVVKDVIFDCIDTLNNLMTEIQIHPTTEEDGNVKLSVKCRIFRTGNSYASAYASLFRLPYPSCNRGVIHIELGDDNNEEIRSTVFHEFSQLLGFDYNLTRDKTAMWIYKSLFNPPTSTFVDSLDRLVEDYQDYTAFDKAAIRIMYDREVAIDPGLTRQKFDRMIAQAKKVMKQ